MTAHHKKYIKDRRSAIVAIAQAVDLKLSFIYNLIVFLECDHRDRLTLFSNRSSGIQA